MTWTPDAKGAYTVQSYAPRPTIDGVEILELKRFADDGGSMTELARLVDGWPQALAGFVMRQINFSEIEPGAIKAFHLHTRQTDVWFVPPSDRVLLVLNDVRAGSRTQGVSMRFMLGSGASRLVRIPPGVAHGARNLGASTGRIIYFTDLHFSPDPAECDEGRLPWDHLGADIWEVTRG
jgi:dTDP-4-dehydrorhamnose 3,5-epimerase-like enzyme